MNTDWRQELEAAIRSDMPLDEVVSLLRRYRAQGIPQGDVYSALEFLHRSTADEDLDDRILEVADFVAGFCSPHLRIWDA
jgi:hypothetical protein